MYFFEISLYFSKFPCIFSIFPAFSQVWLLSDGEVAVIHGEKDGFITLKDGTKHLIESLDYPTLKSEAILPNGCYIPLFREVLELCRGKLRVNVELKGERLELLEKVFEIARNAGSFAEICFSSFFHAFYPRFVQLKREFLVETPVSFGFLLWQEAETREFFAQLPEKPEKLKENRNTVNLEITLLVEFPWIREKVLEILRKGVQICVYFPFRTKETLQNLMFLSKLSVDRVICNDPFVVQRFNELF